MSSPTNRSPPLEKRKSVSPKTPPSRKRQRKQTQMFEFQDATPRVRNTPPTQIAFDKGSFLAIKADAGEFYVCQTTQNITEKAVKAQRSFHMRWLEINQAPNVYNMAYEDVLDPQTIICETLVTKVDKTRYRMEDDEINRLKKLIKATETCSDPYQIDRSLFEPIGKRQKVEDVDDAAPPEENAVASVAEEQQTKQPARGKRKSDAPNATPTVQKRARGNKATRADEGQDKTETKPKRQRKQKEPAEKPTKTRPARTRKKKAAVEPEESSDTDVEERPPLRKVKSVPRPTLSKAATIKLKKQQSLTSTASLKKKATLVQRAKEIKRKVISSKIRKTAGKAKDAKPKKPRAKKPPKPKVDRTDPNRKLIPNQAVTVWEKDPLFESKEKVPFVSVKAHGKLLFRAVLTKDYKLLQELINDSKRIGSLSCTRSLNTPKTPMHYAIENEDQKAMKLLWAETDGDYAKRKARATEARSVLQPESTGTYNWRSLGIKKIRKVQMSRGGKEGNNALTKDLQGAEQEGWLDHAMKHNVSKGTLDFMQAQEITTDYSVRQNIVNVVRTGNRKLAADLVESALKFMDSGFNALHKEALAFSGKETFSMQLREASVKKNPTENAKMTPIHCAAINPNSKYLEQLLAACPEFNLEDGGKWRPIHYAAVCEGTEPLEYLLKQGISAEEGNADGLTPLILACQTGRHQHVELLLKKAREREASVEVVNKKAGPGGVNRALKTSWCPIHFAVAAGHGQVVKVLLANGGDVNRALSATFGRATPLMIAAQNGDLDMVRLLVAHKAKIEMLDKLKKTAVVYACIDGNANVLSFLLSKGSNPNVADTSGNSALHYACAYGWYFCAKLLLDAGAEPDKANDWNLTPMGAAYLKGHQGLARFMMDIPGVNVDFQDNKGMTVLMRCLNEEPLTEDVFTEVKYLIKERRSNPNLRDKQGRNAFHFLARNALPAVYKEDDEVLYGRKLCQWEEERRTKTRAARTEAEKACKKLADLLIEVKCDINVRDNDGNTPARTMIMAGQSEEQMNFALLKRLLELTGEIPDQATEDNVTILHNFACSEHVKRYDIVYFMSKLPLKSGGTGIDVLRKLGKVRDVNHFTPLMRACEKYRAYREVSSWVDKVKKQRRKQREDFIRFLIEDLGSELEYQYDVKDSEDKVIRKDWRFSTLYGVHTAAQMNGVATRWNLFDILFEHKAKIDLLKDNKQTMLMHYAAEGQLDVVHKLLRCGADVNRRLTDEDSAGETPLLLALQQCPGTVSDMVYLLLSSGADVHAERRSSKEDKEVRESALHIAVKKHRNKAVAGLSNLSFVNDLPFGSKNSPGKGSPKKPKLSRKATGSVAAAENAATQNGLVGADYIPKFSHVAPGDMIPVVAMLLHAGVALDVQDLNGATALHLAAGKTTDNADESKDLEQMLIKKGANLFIRDELGRIPLHYVFTKVPTGTVNKKRVSGPTSAMDPVESFKIFQSAMKDEQLGVTDAFGRSPLHYAACRGATVCCMLLIKKEVDADRKDACDVNGKDAEGNTPLSLAVRYEHNGCTLTLMQSGGNISGDVITDPDADKPPEAIKEEEKSGADAATNGTESDSSDSDDYWSDMEQPVVTQQKPSKKKKGMLTVQEVRQRIKKKKVRDPIKWLPRHFPVPWRPGPRGFPIFQGIVQNGWQGLTFIAMDLLKPFGMQYAAAVEIALKIAKFRFALTLMSKPVEDKVLRVCNTEKQNLLHTLASTARDNDKWELQKRIAEDLLDERNVPLNDCDAKGISPLHYSILQTNWNLVTLLLERPDVKVTDHDTYSRTCIAALFWNLKDSIVNFSGRNWLTSTLEKLVKLGGDVNELFDFPPVDSFRGGFRPDIHAENYFQTFSHVKTTALIQAVCHGKDHLMVDLLSVGANVDTVASNGLTPLMYAARLNDRVALNILLSNFNDQKQLATYKENHKKLTEKLVKGTAKKPKPTVDDPFKGIQTPGGTSNSYAGNINAQDSEGRTVFHHLVTSLPTGCFENLSQLKRLSDVPGANWNLKDNSGATPLDYALKRGAHWMAVGLQHLNAKGKAKAPERLAWRVADGVAWVASAAPPDFVADAEEMLRRAETQDAGQEEEEDREDEPDSRTNIDDGYVIRDKEQDVLYDILMTKVDVRIGEWGLYNFYKMQVIYDKDKKLNILFTCWGRIGDTGQYQRTPYGTEEEACQEFCKIFKAKSGNEWSNVKNFEVQPKKYRLIEAKYRKTNTLPDIKFDLESKVPSKLNPYLQEVIKELSNVSMLRGQVNSTGIAVPFGRLKREQLQNALDILQELKPLAEEKGKLQAKLTTDTMEEYREVCEKISSLSSEYYYLVPQKGYQYERLVPLDSIHNINSKLKDMYNLLELETAGKLLLASQLRADEINPIDYIYHALKMQLQLLDEKDPMLQIIMRYVYNTSDVEVEAVYAVSRDGEDARLEAAALDNHKLLWHGSRTSNLISIFHKGLLIAPDEAISHAGAAFGKGIYAADTFSKSQGYCHNDGGGRTMYMLLCEVALGKEAGYEYAPWNEDVPPKGYNSVRANATQTPDPDYIAALPTGVTVPLGKLIPNPEPHGFIQDKANFWGRHFAHNEYIVFSENQVALRYIVQYRA